MKKKVFLYSVFKIAADLKKYIVVQLVPRLANDNSKIRSIYENKVLDIKFIYNKIINLF